MSEYQHLNMVAACSPVLPTVRSREGSVAQFGFRAKSKNRVSGIQ